LLGSILTDLTATLSSYLLFYNLECCLSLFQSSQGEGKKYNQGIMVAALWLVKADKERLDYYFKRISKDSPLSDIEKFKLTEDFDRQVIRVWNDQRTGTKLEPLQVSKSPNKKLASGIARDNLILAGKAGLLFLFQASGTNPSKASIGQKKLLAENARIEAELHPQGNILKSVARYPTEIPSATIAEFGGCDSPSDPTTFSWRSIIESVDDRFDHVQGTTEYTGSHSEITYSQ
jgi:hypothetical protein